MIVIKKVLFWDFDGTLTYSNSLWTGTVYKALKLYWNNDNVTIEDVRSFMTSGFTWHTPENDYTESTGEAWWNLMFHRFSEIYQKLGVEKSRADFISTKTKEMILDVDNYNLYDDTISTLQACKNAGYDNYILSNNYPELAELIEKLNLSTYFKSYIISAKIGYEKPRKEIFEYALKVADNPDVCYMIGDNPIADIMGAKNAEIRTILVHNDKVCDADYNFKNLKEIVDIL